MKNIKPVEIVSKILLVLGFMLFCWAIPSILTGVLGCSEGSILDVLFRVLSTLGLILGSVLVILLSCMLFKAKKSEKESKFHEDE